ncbi:MAG: hypothetical protein WB495_12935 [Xanthobacteraceae bacterium]
MENLIFRGRPDANDECDQWSLVKDPDDREDYVVQEHVKLGEVLSGRPYMRLVKRMTVAEFLGTEQPMAVKQKLLARLDQRKASKD